MAIRLLHRSPNFITRAVLNRCSGYMVLLPEIGDELAERNALLKPNGLPEFDNFTIEKCQASMSKHVFEARSGITKIMNFLKTHQFKDPDYLRVIFLTQFEQINVPLNITWGIAKTLYLCNKSLMPNKYYDDIHKNGMEANFYRYHNETICEHCSKVLNRIKSFEVYSPEEIHIFRKFALEGHLNGLFLRPKNRDKIVNISRDLNKKLMYFKSNIDKNSMEFAEVIEDPNEIKEFPEYVLKMIAPDSFKPHQGPWKVTLTPSFVKNSVLKYCPNRELRKKVWNFDKFKGSGLLNKDLSNQKLINQIRELRLKNAKLLNFDTYFDLSKETKMVQKMQTIVDVLDKLVPVTKAAQQKELKQLVSFAREFDHFPDDVLMPWDVKFYERKLGQSKIEVCEYFELNSVLEKFYGLIENLFGIKIRARKDGVDTWHDDVRYYEVFDSASNWKLGGFYVDPYTRDDGKIRSDDNNGFVISIKNRSGFLNINPLVALIFNFRPVSNKGPVLLTLDDLKCLFFNFGQALVYLLSQVRYSEVAGLLNTELDVVDVTGIVLRHFLQRISVLQSLSEHYKTKQQLSTEQASEIVRQQKLLFATEFSDDLLWSYVDLDLYNGSEDWQELMQKYWEKISYWPYEKKFGYSLCSKSELFVNGSAAVYYRTIWSQLIAADIYDYFERGNDQDVGEKYRKTFLALGGSCSANDKCSMFLEREPKIDALLNMFNKDTFK